MSEGRYAEAIPAWNRALEHAHALDLNPQIQAAYGGLYDCYLHTGDLRKALEYLERAQRMERHLQSEVRWRTVDELEIRYRTAEKEKQLALAENENLLQARQLARQRNLVVVLALALALAAALVLLFRLRQKTTRLEAERERLRHRQELERLQTEKEFAALQALFAGQEQERRRVANDLHDSLGGILYALRLRLPGDAPEKIRQLADTAIAENRRISQALLPPALARVGLVAALREWQPQFEQTFGLPARLYLPAEEPALPDETAVSLFRIAQELLTNAAKHAQATLVTMHLSVSGSHIILRVQDDGAGFNPATLPESAFKTVRSRVRLLGGTLAVGSTPGGGTTLVVEITQK